MIAATQQAVERRNQFLGLHAPPKPLPVKSSTQSLQKIDQKNQQALATAASLQLPRNKNAISNAGVQMFRKYSTNALQKNFGLPQIRVSTLLSGIQLRTKNIHPNHNLDNLSTIKRIPVILARGLWSNLHDWEPFGNEIAATGRDTWLIEITGGPNQDCAGRAVDNCPDYTFNDLTDTYFPKLINDVLTKSGQGTFDYVGFSNGCRTALSSLEKGKVNPAKVDTFVGVGCPGAFEPSDILGGDASLFAGCLNKYGDAIIKDFKNANIPHFTLAQLSHELAVKQGSLPGSCWLLSRFLGGEGRISLNLGQNYLNFVQDNNDPQPGVGLNLKNFTILYGTDGFGVDIDDYVVSQTDEIRILNNIISVAKQNASYRLTHIDLPDDRAVQARIEQAIGVR